MPEVRVTVKPSRPVAGGPIVVAAGPTEPERTPEPVVTVVPDAPEAQPETADNKGES